MTKPILQRHHFRDSHGVSMWIAEFNLDRAQARVDRGEWTYNGFGPVPASAIPEAVRGMYGNA